MVARPELPRSERATFFIWRPLRKDELDHELIWLSTSLGSALFGFVWLKMGKTLPPCTFHTITGWACPTCGMTRATMKLLAGDFSAAFAFNPLYVIALVVMVAFNFYAVAVLVGRLPRLRIGTIPPGSGRWVRWGAVVAVLGNWAWLLYSGV